MAFTIEYEDAKKLWNAFQNVPYQQAVPFINMIGTLKEVDTEITFLNKVILENSLQAQVAAKEE